MDEVKKILESFVGEIYDLCFKLLASSEDRCALFEFVCKNYTSRPKSGTIQIESYFTKEEIEMYESLHGDAINGLLNSTIKKCNSGLIDPKMFYQTLWNSFEVIFTTDKELAFAFYFTLIDDSIPYIFLGKPLSMSNDRFREVVDANDAAIKKVKYIVRSGYNQRTEKASLILNCLDEIGDFESKTVILAQAIAMFSYGQPLRRIELGSLIERIDRRIEAQEDKDLPKEK